MKLVIVTPPMERAAVLEEKRSQGELPAVDTRLPVQEGRRTPTPALCFFTPNPRSASSACVESSKPSS